MKTVLFAAALLMASQASWAGNDYSCGWVNGHSVQVVSGPVLVVDGVNLGLQLYSQDSNGNHYVSADGQYIWSIRGSSGRLYDGNVQFLSSCSRVSENSGGGSGGSANPNGPHNPPYDPEEYHDTWGANPGGGFFP